MENDVFKQGLLAILWEMYPYHENLLPAYLNPDHGMVNYVRKPKLGREGANISVFKSGDVEETSSGNYADSGWVYQELADTLIEGYHAIIGSWLIADQGAAGVGIRESQSIITNNLSRFVPHLIA